MNTRFHTKVCFLQGQVYIYQGSQSGITAVPHTTIDCTVSVSVPNKPYLQNESLYA